jgi:DNA-directed RNA polymerase subunit F
MKPEIINEAPISMPDLKSELESIKIRDKELSFRSTKTEDYLNQFVKISKKEADELSKKLKSLDITRLKDEIIIKIVDLLPDTADDVKTLLQGYVVNLSKKDIDAIVDAVKPFVPDKKK